MPHAGEISGYINETSEAIELGLEIDGEPEKSTQFIGMQRIVV
jgi:hypothetical protein